MEIALNGRTSKNLTVNDLTRSMLEGTSEVSFYFDLADEEKAVSFANQFPKYSKANVSRIESFVAANPNPVIKLIVSLDINLNTDERTGRVNDAGLKRREKFFEIMNIK